MGGKALDWVGSRVPPGLEGLSGLAVRFAPPGVCACGSDRLDVVPPGSWPAAAGDLEQLDLDPVPPGTRRQRRSGGGFGRKHLHAPGLGVEDQRTRDGPTGERGFRRRLHTPGIALRTSRTETVQPGHAQPANLCTPQGRTSELGSRAQPPSKAQFPESPHNGNRYRPQNLRFEAGLASAAQAPRPGGWARLLGTLVPGGSCTSTCFAAR